MADGVPLTVFYDASCPVCALEMDTLCRRARAERLTLVDMSAPSFDAAVYGLEGRDLGAAIHAIRADGTIVRGVEVLRLAYVAGRLGWVVRATGWPLVAPVADAAYRLFARHRHAISRVLAPAIRALRSRSGATMGRRP